MKRNFRLSAICIAVCTAFSCCDACYAVPFTRSDDEKVYSWHENSSKKLALTFDDGPHPTYTAEILELLDEYSAKATFFTIGSCAEACGEILRECARRGHEIGNHTYSHANLRSAPTERCRDEILSAERAIYEASEIRPKLLRPPEGKYSDELCALAEELGYSIILWTVDTRDWAHTSPETIYENVKKNVKSGDIILFHDNITGESPTLAALRLVLPYLEGEGYSFVTVSELINSK